MNQPSHHLPSPVRRGAVLAVLVALALGGPACTTTDDVGALDQPLISDQHHGGVAGFVFLPPIVPAPASFGDFVPTLAPTVVAERLSPADGTTVLATLVTYTRDGARGERVRVHLDGDLPDDGDDDPAGYFVVRFRSADFALTGGDLVRFRVLLDGRELGLADVKVLDRRRDRLLIDRSQYGFVVAGDVLRVKFRVDREALGGGGDGDGDGVDDDDDVCPLVADPAQLDSLGDGTGDACRCDTVVCDAGPGCVAGACNPASGACGAPRCVQDYPAVLSGTVYGVQFGPLADAAVRVTGPDGSVATQPDAAGNFSIEVPYAESELRVSRPGFADYTLPLTFGPDQLAEGYEILLQPVLAWYEVTVWSGPGMPLPGAVVNVQFEGGGGAGGTTDALGRVAFALQPVGVAFRLRVTSPDGLEHESDHAPLTPGSNTILVGLY